MWGATGGSGNRAASLLPSGLAQHEAERKTALAPHVGRQPASQHRDQHQQRPDEEAVGPPTERRHGGTILA